MITMKCSYCENPAVFYRKISNEYLCKTHFVKTVEKKIWRTVRKYKLFSPKEKVVVGVSGGKDSITLLYNILKLQKRYNNSPRVEAILIDEGIKGYREEGIKITKKYCNEWDVPLHIISFKEYFGSTLDDLRDKLPSLKINACTICGTVRRRALNEKALELKADKLAIGHNADDIAQTFLANIIRNDIRKIAINPPQGNIPDLEGNFVPRIKPLMYIPEKEITLYCFYKNFVIQTHPCPYSTEFSILRKKIQDFINNLTEQSPEIKYNLIEANINLYNILNMNKSEIDNNYKNKNQTLNVSKKVDIRTHYNICSQCGKPCGPNRNLCYFCELKNKLNT